MIFCTEIEGFLCFPLPLPVGPEAPTTFIHLNWVKREGTSEQSWTPPGNERSTGAQACPCWACGRPCAPCRSTAPRRPLRISRIGRASGLGRLAICPCPRGCARPTCPYLAPSGRFSAPSTTSSLFPISGRGPDVRHCHCPALSRRSTRLSFPFFSSFLGGAFGAHARPAARRS